jgi:hypothetical protein
MANDTQYYFGSYQERIMYDSILNLVSDTN